jgi:hypothetical protein
MVLFFSVANICCKTRLRPQTPLTIAYLVFNLILLKNPAIKILSIPEIRNDFRSFRGCNTRICTGNLSGGVFAEWGLLDDAMMSGINTRSQSQTPGTIAYLIFNVACLNAQNILNILDIKDIPGIKNDPHGGGNGIMGGILLIILSNALTPKTIGSHTLTPRTIERPPQRGNYIHHREYTHHGQ